MSSLRPCVAPAVALCLSLLVFAGAAAAGTPIVTTDLLRLRSVSAIEVSWDGTKAVIAVRSIGDRPDPTSAVAPGVDAEANPPERRPVNQSHLYLVPITGGTAEPRQLTFGARFDHAPALSPDGRWLAFVRGVVGEGKGKGEGEASGQVWVMPTDGGEARRVTSLPHGAGAPRWSPDGRRLLVTSRVPLADLAGTPAWPSERPLRPWDVDERPPAEPRPDGTRAEIRAWLARNADEQDPTVISRLSFQDEQDLRAAMAFRQLFLLDPTRPDVPPTRLTNDFRDHEEAAFMPDGRSIVFAVRDGGDVHPDRVLARRLGVVGVDGGPPRDLLAVDGWSVRAPRPSADGSVVAFLASRTDQPSYRLTRVGVAAIAAGGASEPVWLTEEETFDASVASLEWMTSRSSLVFNAPRAGGVPLLTMSVGLLEPAVVVDEVDGRPVGVQTFGVGGGAIVYALTAADNPCVVRVRDSRGDRLLLDLNAWVAERELSLPVADWITRPDGLRVQYWLMPPTRFVPTERYPVVLQIHGGPAAMWGPGERSMWHELQLLASWGYGVVYANPRGSGGYGYDFRRANYQDWGAGPAGDVLAVADQVALEPWVDTDRLVVTGGSYGGYLTAWIVAHDHRFKAAVAQRGVYDLATFYGEGNAWQLVEWHHGGGPWDPRVRPVLQRESPFSAVSRIRTPLLIMHASRDLRTGVSQSEMMYRALKRLERPVEYVRYPNAGHDLSRTGDPRQRLDRLNRMIEFFERAIDNPRPAPRPAAE